MGKFYFDIADYVVFSGMLLVSAITGIYYGCRSRYCKSEEGSDLKEYLTGNKSMQAFPVAMSLVASYISGVTILGTPAEIYNFGTQYWFIAFSIWFSGAIVAYVYLPVFCKLQVNSSYEYLEMRFSREVRMLASVLFVMDEIMFLPIVIYVPSLAFNQVTGIDVHLIGSVVCFICIFYTVIGGLKAVVYSDTWQIIVMFISVIVLVILGTIAIGGPSVVWNRSGAGGRLIFNNFNLSMYERHTVYGVVTGGVIFWTAFNGVNQTMVQRYLSLPNEKESKKSVLMFTVGVSLFVSLCVYSGLLVFATYHKCDPMTAGRITQDDQLLPLYVMETVGHLRGVPGLFIAGVFGAALSSLSVVLNATSAVVLEDFVKGCLRISITEKNATHLVKIVILVLGAMSMGFVFVVERMGGVLVMATSLSAIAAGTTFGVFTLGMVIPWSSSIGAITGAVAGAALSGTISFGGQYSMASGNIVLHKLPVNVDLCEADYGITPNVTVINYPDESHIFALFRISYHWITPIGILTTVVVGAIVSLVTGKTDLARLDPELISPVVQFLLPPEAQRFAGTATSAIRNRLRNAEDAALMQEVSSSINLGEVQGPSR
ncbi:hypothetical protein PPYR_08456 [Photinus pyralis]|uniref:Sodium-coupled monocarboxylate transporter 1 n=1 Tax=Photinus pyralis TaxID=7054 RepID=A0A5N4AJK0_PHOPY|nr:sodium-coupled monocarboxylate transporter 1-like [Photinus pyralis]KAB0797463.1 hypothetical protein PPYR_08456 [Photinus pyralis]